MAAAGAAGGLHTLRNIEAGLQAQLSDHRADLRSYVQECARGSEESAVRRVEALLSPPVESLKERLDREVPVIQRATEAAAAEARHEIRAIRADLASETAQLRSELKRLAEALPELREHIRQNADAIASFQGVRRDLWTASESVRASVQEAASALSSRMTEVAEHSATSVEKRWCAPIQERIGAVEAAVREVDTRARHDSTAAMDAAKMVQDMLQCRVEELRLQASQECRQRAAEVAAGLREEVLQGEVVEKFQRGLRESALCLESRVADFRAQLAEKIESSAVETLASADRSSEARLSKLTAEVVEAVEATRRDLSAQERSHAEAVQEWSRQLQEARAHFDAADELSRGSVEGLRGRVGRLADDAAELREGLGHARRSAQDDVSAVRAELRERTARWRAFEELGLPTLLAHVEQRAGEAEGRSLRAALDYAERLRRLPAPPAAAAGRRPPDLGSGDLAAPAPLPPLTPLAPGGGGARRPRAQLVPGA